MSRYKKKPAVLQQSRPVILTPEPLNALLGMLYLVDMRMVNASTGEKIKQKILLVGCEQADIERKIKWLYDSTKYREFSISGIEKIREKVHVLSTVVTQEQSHSGPVIRQTDGTTNVHQQKTQIEQYDPKLYAIGVSTTMLAKDPAHALRKVGNALIASANEVTSHTGASLSEDSTLTIEEIPKSSGYAMPRDVSNEANRAHIMRS